MIGQLGRRWPLAAALAGAGAAVLGLVLLAAGGVVVAHAPRPAASAQHFATAPPRWLAAPHLRDQGYGAAATASGGRVYVLGGWACSPNCTDLATVSAYDPATGTWTDVAPLPAARQQLAAATGADGRVYAVGGIGDYSLGETDVYTPALNTWSAAARLPAGMDVGLAATGGSDGRIYVMGGGGGMEGYGQTTVAAYTPATNTWTAVAPLPVASAYLAAVAAPDGRIYAIGGSAVAGKVLRTVEAYTPRTDTWTMLPSLPAGQAPAAVVGADGRIYAIGSVYGSTPMRSVNALAVGARVWTTVAPLGCNLAGGVAATAGDGRIYVVDADCPGTGLEEERYGPVTAIPPSAGQPGATVALTGTNFAAGAMVRVYWGRGVTGTLLGQGTTDSGGNLTAVVKFTVPKGATTGTYLLTAVDNKSQYPVFTMFMVQ